MIRLLAAALTLSVLLLAFVLTDRIDDHPDLEPASTNEPVRLPSNFTLYVARVEEASGRHPTTTTTRPRPKRRAPVAVAGSYKGLACGGDLPYCSVLRCENPNGDLRAENPTSSASGKWQVIRSTWAGFGGYPEAKNAPETVQDEHARRLWAGGRGASHWRSCLG